jgi:ribose transport system substrate-binding protein
MQAADSDRNGGNHDCVGARHARRIVCIANRSTTIMTQGALGRTVARGRASGFESVVKRYPKIEVLDTQPADWDVTAQARIWETLLTKYPKINAVHFYN